MTNKKRLTAMLLSVLMVLSMIPAAVFTSNAADYSSATNYWWSFGDLYNSSFALSGTGNSLTVTPTANGAMSFTSAQGTDSSSWYPISAATPAAIVPLEKTEVEFSLDTGFGFGNFNGFNGYVSFMWSYGWSGMTTEIAKDNTLPSSLHDMTYNDNSVNGGRMGYANQMIRRTLYGVAVTLAPDPAGSGVGTRTVTNYQVYVKNANGATLFVGALPQSVDLSAKATLSIVKDSETSYSIKLNGTTFKTLDLSSIASSGGGFISTAAVGAYALSNTNFTLHKIAGYAAAVIGSPAYSAEEAIKALPEPSALSADDYADVNTAYGLFDALSSAHKAWVSAAAVTKLTECYEIANGTTSDSGRALADGVECDLADAVAGFNSGDTKILTLLADSSLVSAVTVKAGQRLIVKTGAEYISTSVTGESRGQLLIEETGKIYQWSASISGWKERTPGAANPSVTASFADTESNAFYNTTLAIQCNEVSDLISAIGVIFVPASAITDTSGDGKKNQLDISESVFSNSYAVTGSMTDFSLPDSGAAYFSASMFAASSYYAYTLIECWYIEYNVGDTVNKIYVKDSNTDKYGAYKLKYLLGIEEEPQPEPEVLSTSFTVSHAISNDMVVQRDENINVWGWAPSAQNGKTVKASFGGLTGSAVIANGEWTITLNGTLHANSTGQTLTVYGDGVSYNYTNVLVGDVYFVIGQSNIYYATQDLINSNAALASYITISDTYNIRLNRTSNIDWNASAYPAQGSTTVVDDVLTGRTWLKPSQYALQFSALGYKFATELYENNNGQIPIGMIEIDAAGNPLTSFLPNEVADARNASAPSALHTVDMEINGLYYNTYYTNFVAPMLSRYVYNQFINPYMNFSISGLLWYQGESDYYNFRSTYGADRGYCNDFAALIEYMRDNIGNADGNFPVFFTELPSCYPTEAYIDFGAIRSEMGYIPLILDNCYFSASADVWSDTTYANNLHPYCKLSQAYRSGCLALAVNYGKYELNNIAGPQYTGVTYNGTSAQITFEYIGTGLTTSTNTPNTVLGFEVFTASGWVAAASAQITATNQITVTSSTAFSAIRYNATTTNFHGTTLNLSSSTGVPAIAFTDYQ